MRYAQDAYGSYSEHCECDFHGTQLHLLDQHQQTLSERQRQLSNIKTSSSHAALVLPLHPLNPLIPQEQQTSKYAAMVRDRSRPTLPHN